MELEIPVIAIAQPRKLEPGQIMTAWDLKETVDLFSDADQLLILHRQQLAARKDAESFTDAPPDTLYSPYTLVRVNKSRFGGPKDTMICLEGEHHYFRDLRQGETIEYRGSRGGQRSTTLWSTPAEAEEIPDWVTDEEDQMGFLDEEPGAKG